MMDWPEAFATSVAVIAIAAIIIGFFWSTK